MESDNKNKSYFQNFKAFGGKKKKRNCFNT